MTWEGDRGAAGRRLTPRWILAFLVLGLGALLHGSQCGLTVTTSAGSAVVVHEASATPIAVVLASGDAAGIHVPDSSGTAAQPDPHPGTGGSSHALAACLMMLAAVAVALFRLRRTGGGPGSADDRPPWLTMLVPQLLAVPTSSTVLRT
ncbi:hypothetical protein [Spirilliplanes yamanashiensis]|uniref:hypothetical protein n=1 Tax=Spirilliplanes yamanashiensis TaxID=42233 RepID=UPI0019520A22|nr:hypothetical protein [Spirilliplanes yamanashiensis]MDP9818373.1 hypothetical protein [Spirilliplanes yamanashiensis]